jgi:hypothetical protein
MSMGKMAVARTATVATHIGFVRKVGRVWTRRVNSERKGG